MVHSTSGFLKSLYQVLLFSTVLQSAVAQRTIEIPAFEDNDISSGIDDNVDRTVLNYARATTVFVGSDVVGQFRTLINFDYTSLGSLPIASASIRMVKSSQSILHVGCFSGSQTTCATAHVLTTSWSEGNGFVTNATFGDSSWLHSSFPDLWVAPGGDFNPSPIGQEDPLLETDEYVFFSLDVEALMTARLDGTLFNGFILQNDENAGLAIYEARNCIGFVPEEDGVGDGDCPLMEGPVLLVELATDAPTAVPVLATSAPTSSPNVQAACPEEEGILNQCAAAQLTRSQAQECTRCLESAYPDNPLGCFSFEGDFCPSLDLCVNPCGDCFSASQEWLSCRRRDMFANCNQLSCLTAGSATGGGEEKGNTGIIVGAACGGVLLLVVGAGVALFLRKKQKNENGDGSTSKHANAVPMDNHDDDEESNILARPKPRPARETFHRHRTEPAPPTAAVVEVLPPSNRDLRRNNNNNVAAAPPPQEVYDDNDNGHNNPLNFKLQGDDFIDEQTVKVQGVATDYSGGNGGAPRGHQTTMMSQSPITSNLQRGDSGDDSGTNTDGEGDYDI